VSQYEITATDEIFNHRDDQEDTIDYLWDGIIPRRSVTTFVGPKKERKSWLALALALSAIAKEPLFEGFPSGGQRVMYISGPGENRLQENRRRLRGLARGHGVQVTDDVFRLVTSPHALLRANDQSFAGFLADVASFGPDIVILDSVSALWGGNDERDNTEVRQWFAARLLPLTAVRPLTVVMLAHTGKGLKAGRSRFEPREQRGASEWGAVADASVYVANAKAEHASRASVEFARIGDLDPRTLQFTITGGGKAGLAIRFEATWDGGMKVVKPGQLSEATRALIKALEAATEMVTKSPVIRPVLLGKLEGLGHSKDARRGAIKVLTGKALWPSGPCKGQAVAHARVDQGVNPETQRPVDLYVWTGAAA